MKGRFRKILLQFGLFRWVDHLLYIGTQNRHFYKHFGVSEEKLVFAPYCVDNHRFQSEAHNLLSDKNRLRRQLDLPEDVFVLLFSGKYISKKRPLDLLKAIAALGRPDIVVVFVGEGELRPEMEKFIREHQLERQAVLTGFVNQSSIPAYYSVADTFVMCSGVGETWGLSVNEAMNFSLPVIVSDLTGCAADLVTDGENGYVYRCGDVSDLADKISRLQNISGIDRARMGAISRKRVDNFNYAAVIAGLQKI